MRISFRPEARSEILEARNWYESRARGLGQEFARSVDAAVSTAAGMPELFSPIVGAFRRVLLRKFPYSLVFSVFGNELLVVAVFHHRRHPLRLMRRLEP